ncbi:MAG: NAD-dependent epimerase/dehydratase family protein [Candidatus Aegiribacteria sp.]|nr:NAD-dependent epimerase/dehydratase family protein [Candidatus Aegiribacteria sp.]
MKYMVTGAAGFIGSHLARELLSEGKEVVAVDCFRDYYPPELKRDNIADLLKNPSFKLFEEDLSGKNMSWLDTAFNPPDEILVYHLAAQAGVRKSWGEEFSRYTTDNIMSTQNLLEWSVKRGNVKNFIYASSSSVYGRVQDLPMVEDTTLPMPDSPYGVTKLAAENLVRLYTRNYGLPSLSLRFFTVYGPGQRPDMAFSIFLEAISKGNPIRIFGDGSQTRDFTYVGDVVRGLRLSEECTDGRVMNLGGGNTLPLLEAIGILEEAAGMKAELSFLPVQPGDVRDTFASTELLYKTTGWKPTTPLIEGLRRQLRGRGKDDLF